MKRLILITGGSKGLGAELCQQYTDTGDTVIEFSRSAPFLFSVQVDMADPDIARRAFDTRFARSAEESWDEIIAINNAAVLGPIGPLHKQSTVEIQQHIAVNITSGMLFFAAVQQHFSWHTGRKLLVSITSGAATHGYAGWSLYCASKAAMDNHVRALAEEQQSTEQGQGFIPISINPGLVDTSMQELIRSCSPREFPAVEKFHQRLQDGKLQPPARVAAAVRSICAQPALESGAIYKADTWM